MSSSVYIADTNGGRSDRRRTRERLLDAMGELVPERGWTVTLPEIARAAGVATATVYRHFEDIDHLRQEFYDRTVATFGDELRQIAEETSGWERFERICDHWLRMALEWARPASYLRSAEGYLERARRGERHVAALHATLVATIDQLIEQRVIPPQDTDYAALVWITLFDERVLVDLHESLGWPADQIVASLSGTVLAALMRAPVVPPPPPVATA